ncbi:dehydrogenase/reductase SDR family member 11-like [Neolamprologus brichardi]|uniref:dehydrogenase/reductase SDR family member 11-like n=1 Tax=Neolamprologus brichardi TaxID=32507 RepID=UPI001643E065|nr:dehydrogenase/reductase SDR family member 11-like [Neolamprologus brichardi]
MAKAGPNHDPPPPLDFESWLLRRIFDFTEQIRSGSYICDSYRAVMERWRGRVALVTGASVGIGAAIAVELVRLGMKVVGCARDVGKIQDVCINNAGLAHPEPLLSGETSGWKNMMDVNILGLSICTREAYQSMKERNVDDGHIININSMSGHRVLPSASTHFYTATKFAVTALTEGLRQELRAEKTHIRATSISPGLVETEFGPRLFKDDPDKAAGLYSEYKPLEAKDVASSVVYVLSAPPHVQIGDIQMRGTEQVS